MKDKVSNIKMNISNYELGTLLNFSEFYLIAFQT
jgi:hypothetical protein